MQLEQPSKSPNQGDGLLSIFFAFDVLCFSGHIRCAALLLVLKSIVSTIKDLLTMEPFSRQTGIHINPIIKALGSAQELNN